LTHEYSSADSLMSPEALRELLEARALMLKDGAARPPEGELLR
jgi:hypothetical protein